MELNKDKSSHTVAAAMRVASKSSTSSFTKKRCNFKRKFNRFLLPSPLAYYTKQFIRLKIKSEWVKVSCCFHEPDNNPSLSISMVNGHFKCFACGAKGCDVIAFHRLRYGVSFSVAVTLMGAWEYA